MPSTQTKAAEREEITPRIEPESAGLRRTTPGVGLRKKNYPPSLSTWLQITILEEYFR
jgi:hypothetical protein